MQRVLETEGLLPVDVDERLPLQGSPVLPICREEFSKSPVPTGPECIRRFFLNWKCLVLDQPTGEKISYFILIVCQRTSWVVISRCMKNVSVPTSPPAETKIPKEGLTVTGKQESLCPKATSVLSMCGALLLLWLISMWFFNKALKCSSPVSSDINSWERLAGMVPTFQPHMCQVGEVEGVSSSESAPSWGHALCCLLLWTLLCSNELLVVLQAGFNSQPLHTVHRRRFCFLI